MPKQHQQAKPTFANTREFVHRLRDDFLEKGQGIVPFVGSGVSAPSGILMGQDFTDYLGYTVFRVVFDREKWNIRHHGWPKFPNRAEVETARSTLLEQFKGIAKREWPTIEIITSEDNPHLITQLRTQKHDHTSADEDLDDVLRHLTIPLIPQIILHWDAEASENKRRTLYQQLYGKNPLDAWKAPTNSSPTSLSYLQEFAIRSLFDWRATLSFLSSVELPEPCIAGCEACPRIGPSDTSIIDSFNAHITREKRPNLSHTMLAHLLRPLRARTILTTNFDSLLEDSLYQLNEPLQVFQVSNAGRLPSFRTITGQNCLIKLHGSLAETRADFTLDDPPSPQDRQTFAAYFCGEPSTAHSLQPSHKVGIQHLFVIGYSGRDQRTIQLIKGCLDAHPDFRLFWVCHTQADLERITKIFTEKEYADKIITLICDRPDLLLYELYQCVCRCLPGGGSSFQYSPNVPPKPLLSDDPSQRGFNEDTLKKHLAEWTNETGKSLHILDTESGVTTWMFEAFNRLQSCGHSAIWLELDDYFSVDAVFYELLQVLALKLGYYQLEHVALLPASIAADSGRTLDSEEVYQHLSNILSYLGVTARKWVIFFYGRAGAGVSGGIDPKPWATADFERFRQLLAVLQRSSFRIVYLPYSETRLARDEAYDTRLQRGISQAVPVIKKLTPPQEQVLSELANYQQLMASREPFSHPCDTVNVKDTDVDRQPETFFKNLLRVIGVNLNVPKSAEKPWLNITDMVSSSDGSVSGAEEEMQKLQFLYCLTLFR